MAVAQFTPSEILKRIRYDPLAKKGSVLDVIQLVTGCDSRHASRTLQRILDSHPDIHPNWMFIRFEGYKQKPTKAGYLKDLIEIAWLCPGKHAKEFRRTGAVTLCRALGGDLSLVEDIKRRRGEVTTEEQEALLAGTGVSAAEANGQAVARVEETAEERQDRLKHSRLETAMLEVKLKKEQLDVFQKQIAMLQELTARETDARHVMRLQDMCKNLTIQYGSSALNQPAQGQGLLEYNDDHKPISISEVAAAMGHKRLAHEHLVAIGRVAARLFREEHGEGPPKHQQYVDGAVREVASYFTKDRTILETAVHSVMD